MSDNSNKAVLKMIELVEHCMEMTDCENCPRKYKEKCKEWKRIINGISEPWEMPRLLEMEK